jgi:hypothetical protein
MPRLMLLRLVAGLFAAATLVTSAWAFSQQSTGPGDGNSSFADPDDQITNSFGVRPLDSNEHHFGVQQQGTFDPGGSNRYTATALIIRRPGLASERGRLTRDPNPLRLQAAQPAPSGFLPSSNALIAPTGKASPAAC